MLTPAQIDDLVTNTIKKYAPGKLTNVSLDYQRCLEYCRAQFQELSRVPVTDPSGKMILSGQLRVKCGNVEA